MRVTEGLLVETTDRSYASKNIPSVQLREHMRAQSSESVIRQRDDQNEAEEQYTTQSDIDIDQSSTSEIKIDVSTVRKRYRDSKSSDITSTSKKP